MKGKKKVTPERRFYVQLAVFLLTLGILPASLLSGDAIADTTREVPESTTEVVDAKSQLDYPDETTTVELSEDYQPAPEPETTQTVITQTPTQNSTPVQSTGITQTITVTVVAPPDQIVIGGNTIPIFYSSNTLTDSGTSAGLYGDHFIYGHNTSDVFGNLASLPNGTRFTVSLNGTTKTYQIVGRDLQEKSHFEGVTLHKTVTSGLTMTTKMKIMTAITRYGEYDGNFYDYIIMTCAGTSYGNGDASHRLVIFANEVH